jgi:hypothetical protein
MRRITRGFPSISVLLTGLLLSLRSKRLAVCLAPLGNAKALFRLVASRFASPSQASRQFRPLFGAEEQKHN